MRPSHRQSAVACLSNNNYCVCSHFCFLYACSPNPWRRAGLSTVALAKVDGAGDRTRTYDPLITNEMLYQLSYTGNSPSLYHLFINFQY